MLFDRFGRPLTNLRIMVTGRCNFKCFFCHMEGYSDSIAASELSLEEISIIAEAAKRLNIKKFKLTGGEPLLRRDIVSIVDTLTSVRGKVSITTNGSLLVRYASQLAGKVTHINVSLHSLRREVFMKITGVDALDEVLAGIRAAVEHGIPVKINFVVLRGLNDNEIDELVDFVSSINARLQIIELHPVGRATRDFDRHHLPASHVVEKLAPRIAKVNIRQGLHARPIFTLDNGVVVELVGPVGNYIFCSYCTRIRVTYDAKLQPCLNWRGPLIELRPRWRKASSFEEKVEETIEAFKEANRLRRPTYLWRTNGTLYVKPRRSTLRLGLPKRSGELRFTGPNPDKHLAQYISEWLDDT